MPANDNTGAHLVCLEQIMATGMGPTEYHTSIQIVISPNINKAFFRYCHSGRLVKLELETVNMY